MIAGGDHHAADANTSETTDCPGRVRANRILHQDRAYKPAGARNEYAGATLEVGLANHPPDI